MKRILLISSNSSGHGGGERHLVFLAEGLVHSGFEVHALVSTADFMDGWYGALRAVGAYVHRAELKNLRDRRLRFLSAIVDRRQIDLVREISQSLAPDAILVNQQYDEDGLDYLLGAIASGVSSVAGVIHMPMTAGKKRRPFGRLRGNLLRHWFKRNPYTKIFVSSGAQNEFHDYYGPCSNSHVINNAVPLAQLSYRQDVKLGSRGGSPATIGFVGQLVPQKNLDLLIRAWRQVRQTMPEVHLLLVGDGPERCRIEEMLAQSAEPGGWHITGWSNQPELLFGQMDVFAMSSHFEGLPLSLVEAAARGICCVVTPFNGASDVSRHAAWVRVSDGWSLETFAHLLETSLRKSREGIGVNKDAIERFHVHFSLPRMAIDYARVLDLKR